MITILLDIVNDVVFNVVSNNGYSTHYQCLMVSDIHM